MRMEKSYSGEAKVRKIMWERGKRMQLEMEVEQIKGTKN